MINQISSNSLPVSNRYWLQFDSHSTFSIFFFFSFSTGDAQLIVIAGLEVKWESENSKTLIFAIHQRDQGDLTNPSIPLPIMIVIHWGEPQREREDSKKDPRAFIVAAIWFYCWAFIFAINHFGGPYPFLLEPFIFAFSKLCLFTDWAFPIPIPM